MQNSENVMRVTIHAAYLEQQATDTSRTTQLLQKVVRTIEQFESKGWRAELVDQDDTAATITFRRAQSKTVAETSSTAT